MEIAPPSPHLKARHRSCPSVLSAYFEEPAETVLQQWMDNLLQIGGAPGTEATLNNQRIDAGWTYFGQLLAHDLTYKYHGQKDYVPSLDLNSLYGKGPVKDNVIFSFREENPALNGVMFALKTYEIQYPSDDLLTLRKEWIYDFKRGSKRPHPIIYDPRNDDNYVISQLVCTLKRFHNKIAQYWHQQYGLEGTELYEKTRALVCAAYQQIVLLDYLPRLLMGAESFVGKLLGKKGFKLVSPDDKPCLMREFNVAAFRMGHSQVRDTYVIHQHFGSEWSLWGNEDGRSLRGFVNPTEPRPGIQWDLFFDFPDVVPTKSQKSRLIDLIVINPLGHLPFKIPKTEEQNLAHRNMERSVTSKLVLSRSTLEKLKHDKGLSIVTENTQATDPNMQSWIDKIKNIEFFPLWGYILLEARLLGCDYRNNQYWQHLGPLGSHIVGEQMVWAILHSRFYTPNAAPQRELSLNIPHFSIYDAITIAQKGVKGHPAFQVQ